MARSLESLHIERRKLEAEVEALKKQKKRADSGREAERDELTQAADAAMAEAEAAEAKMLGTTKALKSLTKQSQRAQKEQEQAQQREAYAQQKQRELEQKQTTQDPALRRQSTLKTGKKKSKKKKS